MTLRTRRKDRQNARGRLPLRPADTYPKGTLSPQSDDSNSESFCKHFIVVFEGGRVGAFAMQGRLFHPQRASIRAGESCRMGCGQRRASRPYAWDGQVKIK